MVAEPGLFDTNIVIDYLVGVPQAAHEIERYSDRAISVVTWIEVLAGSEPDEEEDHQAFLRKFRLIAVSDAIAQEAVRIRRRTRLKLPDAIILASARVEGRVLITRNTRDFSPDLPGIRVSYRL